MTVGAAEANALVCSTLLEPGDRVTVVEPGYRQVRGMAENMGCAVDVVQLRDEDGWELDVDELRAKRRRADEAARGRQPEQPDRHDPGRRGAGGDPRRRRVDRLLAARGRGLPRLGAQTASRRTSFWAQHPRAIARQQPLEGLRALRPPHRLGRRAAAARRRAAAPARVRRHLGEPAERLPRRARTRAREARRAAERGNASSCATEPRCTRAGSTSTPRSSRRNRRRRRRCRFRATPAALPSEQVADAIRTRASVLVVPGSMLGSEGHLRLTVGFEPDFLGRALDRIASVLGELA